MPALGLLPNSEHLGRTIYEGGVFDGRIYSRDVVKSALKNMGVISLRAVEKGVARTRQVPSGDGLMSPGGVVVGLSLIDPTLFVRHSWERTISTDETLDTESGGPLSEQAIPTKNAWANMAHREQSGTKARNNPPIFI